MVPHKHEAVERAPRLGQKHLSSRGWQETSGGGGRGAHLQAHSGLCRFFRIRGLPVSCCTVCSPAPALKTTEERGKCKMRPPTSAQSGCLPEPSTACGLRCRVPSQVSSKQVGPRRGACVPGAEPKVLEGIRMVAEDTHHLPGTDGGSGFPGTQVGPLHETSAK